MTARALLIAAGGLLAACQPQGPRPPEPAAQEGVVNASVSVTVEAAVQVLADEAIPMGVIDREQRVVETQYFDLVIKLPEARTYPIGERTVRYRILVAPDTLGRGSRLAIQALYQPFGTQGVYSEKNDRAVPRGHPGITLARTLFERTRSLAER